MSDAAAPIDRETPVSRRRLLLIGTYSAVGFVVAAGCDSSSPGSAPRRPAASSGSPSPSASPESADLRMLVRAITAEEAALMLSTTVRRRFRQERERLAPVVASQQAHVERMRAALSHISPPADHNRPRIAQAEARAIATVTEAVKRLAAERTADCLAARSGLLAQLMGSVAASHSVTASALTGEEEAADLAIAPPASVADVTVFADCLRAEHAAVFGYGVLGGVLEAGVDDSPLAKAADESYDVHLRRRDQLTDLFTAAGRTPPAAEPAYRLPLVVSGAASARRLAQHLETGCAAVYLQALSAASGDGRRFASEVLTDAALRAVDWGAAPVSFPGYPS